MPKRRTVHFDSLSDVLREAENLLRGGYERAGNWSLGTMGNHLGRAMIYSCDGFLWTWPRPIQFLARLFSLGSILKRKPFRMRIPAPITVQWNIPDQDGLECLATGIKRFAEPDSGTHPHIILGKLSRDEWLQFHLWHCEHHFGFLLPAGEKKAR